MPDAQAVEALVVGGAPSGDADRVVHLLTPDGRLAVFAPQAKRSRRRFGGALEPFTTIEAQLAPQKKRSGLPTLTDATVRRARLALRRDLSTIALASYFSELGFRTAPEGQSTEVPTLVEAAWDRLLNEPATRRLRRTFELRLMAELGYAPELDRCVACGVAPDMGFVDLVRGGLLCAIHRGASTRVGPKTLHWLRAVLSSPELDESGGVDSEWAETAATKCTGPFVAFFQSLMSRPLHATALLAEVDL